ncbi:hypothetical protein Cadr_000000576 [Camelus dromedarius]|uniref:Uncharacterized protein n=1 Tax=Camelus dromedarius TaxID=9838 RepID=A0A5N4EKK4_CAMDR|nr:hypothetical protein Cadr_000000576 [Camelus dromedarius]
MEQTASSFPAHPLLIQPLCIYILLDGGTALRLPLLSVEQQHSLGRRILPQVRQ